MHVCSVQLYDKRLTMLHQGKRSYTTLSVSYITAQLSQLHKALGGSIQTGHGPAGAPGEGWVQRTRISVLLGPLGIHACQVTGALQWVDEWASACMLLWPHTVSHSVHTYSDTWYLQCERGTKS